MFGRHRAPGFLRRLFRLNAAGGYFVAAASLTAVLSMPAQSVAAESPGDRDGFIAAYQCEITLRLVVMHRLGDRAREDDRYLILSLKDAPQYYVQCAYFDRDRKMMCEAASGYFSAAEGKPPLFHLPDDRIAALAALGFSTDAAQGNYRMVMKMKGVDSYGDAGKLLLGALYDGFGARLGAPIEVTAPLLQTDKPKDMLKGNCAR